MTRPLRPHEVGTNTYVPDEVIQAFNELILKYWNGHESRFKQDEAASLIRQKMNMRPQTQFDKRYLDVEPIYRKLGWKVEYDKPGFNESYPATFTFKK